MLILLQYLFTRQLQKGCFSMKTFLYITTALLLASIAFCPAAVADETQMFTHHISVSFDLQHHLVRGTSRITLPPERHLSLACGPLSVTGTILEKQTGPPQSVGINQDNAIHLKPEPSQRTLYLSWELKTDQSQFSDNTISEKGITLAGFWHPLADMEMHFSLEVQLPQDFLAITEGGPLKIEPHHEGQLGRAHIDHPVKNIHLAAGPYIQQTRQVGKVTLHSFFFKEDQHLGTEYLSKTADYITLYEQLIGPFPFPSYSIVENRLPTGYGMAGFTLLGQSVVRLPFIVDTSLGHEVLHSWFGNSITVDPQQGNWAEGLTTYMADHYFANQQNQGKAYRKNQLLKYQAYADRHNPIALEQFHSASHQQSMSKMMRTVGYEKGALFFHMLKNKIGWDAFLQGVRHFYRSNVHQEAGWQELEEAFSQAAKKDLSQFFTQWLRRADIPSLGIERIDIRQKKGKSVLSFDLVQYTTLPYTLDVEIIVQSLYKEVHKTITTSSLNEHVELQTNTLPTQLLIDPNYHLLRSLAKEENVPTWARFLGSQQKKILVPQSEKNLYQPLIASLVQKGASVFTEKSATNQELQNGDWLLLGDSRQRRSLFAGSLSTQPGFTLGTLFNPLNNNRVVVLVDSSTKEETAKVIRKLSHYGKYSSLAFLEGKLQHKQIAGSENGIRYSLLTPPSGIPAQTFQPFTSIIERLSKADIVYLGETHTEYSHHLLQLQVIQGLYAKGKKLIIGLEMFPRSSQQALDDYILHRTLSETEFLKQSAYYKVWGFDYRYYRGIINFAWANRIPLIALNLEKEITNTVFRTGATDALSEKQRNQAAAERDLTLPGYQKRLTQVHSMHQSPHSNQNFAGFIQAQAIWDETMAEGIVQSVNTFPDHQLVVIAGTGHVDKQNGIPPRVKRRKSVTQEVIIPRKAGFSFAEVQKQADFFMDVSSFSLPQAGKIGVVLDVEKELVSIAQISPHGHAEEAGLRVGDIIESINDQQITSVADVKISLLDQKVGDQVTVQINRKGKPHKFSVELSSMQRGMLPPGHPKINTP